MNVSAIFPLPLIAACFIFGKPGFTGRTERNTGQASADAAACLAPWQLNSWVHRENVRDHHGLYGSDSA